jgi:hypothetical protein
MRHSKQFAVLFFLDLLFHICSCKTPNESWTTLEWLFGKQDEMRGHMLEVELLTFNPKSFDHIQYLFTKLKNLLSQLKACRVDKSKEEKKMVLTILSKIGPKFSVFISTFHYVRFSSGANCNMCSLEDFIESLTQEKTKLINMGTIKGPRVHALTVLDGIQKYHKYKDNDKPKSHAHPKKEGYTKPSTDASRLKGEKGRKWQKCMYCHKGFHMESTCMQKKYIYFVSNNLGKQPWILHPRGCKEEEARRSEFQERKF